MYHMSGTMFQLNYRGYVDGTDPTILIENNHFEHQFKRPTSATNPDTTHGQGIAHNSSVPIKRNQCLVDQQVVGPLSFMLLNYYFS